MSFLYCLLLCMAVSCKTDPPYYPAGGDKEPPVVTEYQPIALTAGAAGEYTEKDGTLNVKVSTANSTYGVCLPKLAKGHFIAELAADKSVNYGIAIVREKDGKPDYSNYTSVSVCLEGGLPVVRVLDRQSGKDNVLDNTGKITGDSERTFRYAVQLDGNYFSVPYTAATGKIRIIRNDLSGFFHFYVGVGKELNGEFHENWLELAQSKDWSGKGQNFFVCPIVRTGSGGAAEVGFSGIRFEEFDPRDVSDTSTGFAVGERNYTWAGFPGRATVVTFDPKQCPAASGDRKFVFWSETNYVPAWHMNNDLLYCYEFAETWSDLAPGCFEPMSDRLLAYTTVDVIEDNNVRKVVKYHYALVNPDYNAPYPGGVFPEVDEYYTFYPDGTGVRRIEYIQKAAGEGGYRYHELSEPMVISGSSSVPSDHVKNPAFVITNLSGGKYSLYPDRSQFGQVNDNVKNWTEQIYTTRLNNAPDAFCVFSYSPGRPEVSPLGIENDLTWHNTTYQMSHWPVDKQPYLYARSGDYDKSMATWPSQVSHSSLIGVEAKGNTAWDEAYQLKPNGDKFRVYLMLLGINQPDATEDLNAAVRSWLCHGTFSGLQSLSYDTAVTGYSKREIVLQRSGPGKTEFTYNPGGMIKNPVFRIDGWGQAVPSAIKENGNTLVAGNDYACDVTDGSLVVWLNRTTSQPFTLSFE